MQTPKPGQDAKTATSLSEDALLALITAAAKYFPADKLDPAAAAFEVLCVMASTLNLLAEKGCVHPTDLMLAMSVAADTVKDKPLLPVMLRVAKDMKRAQSTEVLQ